MASDPRRVEQLNLAASFSLFDKKLRSSGNASLAWGIVNLLIGVGFVAAHNYWGLVSLLFGLGLIVAGSYERQVRAPKVIIVSAVSLAGLAIWDFVLIGLSALGKVQLAGAGRTLFWAIAQAWGAYATWKTYSEYKMLHEKSDPATVEQVRGYVDELKKTKPEQCLDTIEFEVNMGFLQTTRRYRLKLVEDLYLVARYKAELRRLQLEDVTFIPRKDVTLTPVWQKRLSKKMKASVQLGALKLERVSITPEMAERIDPAARVIALGAT